MAPRASGCSGGSDRSITLASAQEASFSPEGCQSQPRIYSQKAAGKFACFARAISEGRRRDQLEQECRARRLERLREGEASTEGGRAPDRGLFHERENCGLLAVCRSWSTADFDPVRILGRGAFGVVHLVERKADGQRLALKQIDKAGYSRKNRARLYTERDAMAVAAGQWCVTLHATFQDRDHVYMLMDFLPGGDLMFHLIKRDRFTDVQTAFYMAELLEGLDFVHSRGLIHRDVKPDNLVLGPKGHLKLLDFGLCKQADGNTVSGGASRKSCGLVDGRASGVGGGRRPARHERHGSTVGTFEYMAPEVLFGSAGYGPEVDFWSLGVITFECLAGGIPFNLKHLDGQEGYECMCAELADHDAVFGRRLRAASAAGCVGAAASHLLRRLVCHKESRLAAGDVRREPFFQALDFARLHLLEAPFADDCAAAVASAGNFDDLGRQELPPANQDLSDSGTLQWALFEYDREADELSGSGLDLEALVRPPAEPQQQRQQQHQQLPAASCGGAAPPKTPPSPRRDFPAFAGA